MLTLLLLVLLSPPVDGGVCDRSCDGRAPRTADGCCILGGASSDYECPYGQIIVDGSLCCWPGQEFDDASGECSGEPDCPTGYSITEDEADCRIASCPAGKVRNEDTGTECCWPKQVYSTLQGRCIGPPQCPEGSVQDGEICRGVGNDVPPKPVDTQRYVRVEAGDFLQGSPANEWGRFKNEAQRKVSITKPFLVKATEVTQQEWTALMGSSPSRFLPCGGSCPVERINWYEALAYVNRLSKKEGLAECYVLSQCRGTLGEGCSGKGLGAPFCAGSFQCVVNAPDPKCMGYRLPTEAEWEFAARAGALGTWTGVRLEDTARFSANSVWRREGGADCSKWPGHSKAALGCGPGSVGQLQANGAGIYDMQGNVLEWVWDGMAPYAEGPQQDPVTVRGLRRVARGGAWTTGAQTTRLATRFSLEPSGRSWMVGFRPVRTAPPVVAPMPSPEAPATPQVLQSLPPEPKPLTPKAPDASLRP